MKNTLFKITLFLILLFTAITSVKAEGTISANYISNKKVTEGDIISIDINISNVSSEDGKMYSFGGYIDFDKEYLEFISFEGKNGFDGLINTKNYKIALIDYTLSKGTSNGTIGTITFKTLKSGETTLSFRNPSGTDKISNLTVKFSDTKIKINTKEVVKKMNDVKKQTKKTSVKETKTEVKEEVVKTQKFENTTTSLINYLRKFQIFKFIPFLKI